jgi:glucose dehydrogenase
MHFMPESKPLIQLICSLLIFMAANGMAQNEVNWPVPGGDPGSMRYSPLTDINASNVKQLQLAWKWSTGEKPIPEKDVAPGGFEATPIVIDGVLYVSTPYNRVVALSAETGNELWSYDPESYNWGPGVPGVTFGRHRGVASWTDGAERRIFLNTRWRLIALDSKTGKPITTFGENGEIDLTKNLVWPVTDKPDYMNTSPPVIYKNLVIVGSAVSDSLVYEKSPPGDVQAFDVHSGKRIWSFHTIPQKGEFGNETWQENSWQFSGHTNVWTPIALDERRGLLYLAVSTPANDYYGGKRKGSNLFADSLLCLDANTGKRIWHYQTVHHGLFDYDGVMAPTLGTIRANGQTIDAVAAVSKTGFTYVFDRVTGKPVWPIVERPVPQTDVPGERTSPTQPFPLKPPPFAMQGFTENDVVDFTPELKGMALEMLKKYRHGPIFMPPSFQGTVLLPGNGGGANWGGSSFDPETGMLYVKATNIAKLITLQKPEPGEGPKKNYPGAGSGDYFWHFPTQPMVAGNIPINKPPYGTLTAIDLNRGEIAWQVPVGDTPSVRNNPALKGLDLPPLGSAGNAGAMITRGGLAFIGGGDIKFHALDKATGKEVWAENLGMRSDANSMTFRARDGRQFVVVAAGSGAQATLFAFSLSTY